MMRLSGRQSQNSTTPAAIGISSPKGMVGMRDPDAW
jgi:hypothetical protein